MVKKLKAMADEEGRRRRRPVRQPLAGSVKESAQQIWLAGMGAFAKAQAEGGKVFEALVKEGVACSEDAGASPKRSSAKSRAR